MVLDTPPDISLDDSSAARMAVMPLNYLGYTVEFAHVAQQLPEDVSTDRYAGVVVWLNNSIVPNQSRYTQWVRQQIEGGMRVAFMGRFGMPVDGAMGQTLGLEPVRGRAMSELEIVKRDPMVGFEMQPILDRRDVTGIRVKDDARSLLRLRSGQFEVDAGAITSWGGYLLYPYVVFTMDDVRQNRWIVQPLDFLRQALALPAMPAPDVTTENGRRLMLTHIDGDGFASRAEFPGAEYGADALLKDVLERYRVPTTWSVIEGEIAATGLYPKLAPTLEPLARKIYNLPYVEVASHTYSHPYEWSRTIQPDPYTGNDEAFHLEIPGYKMNLDREIVGTRDYINQNLVPPSKKVKVLLWSGDCQPPAEALRKAYAAGMLNMNGGDTLITRSNPSWTAIAPLGLNKGEGAFQVFAPHQNENIYTNEWTGPYYGFERVIETFEMTDKPIRFKPLNIYYHTYSGTKAASVRALRKVYDYAMSQPVMPIYASDYIRKVLDFQGMAVARDGDTWVVRGAGDLRTVRVPGEARPQLAGSQGVVGFSNANGGQGTYVHLDGGTARFQMGAAQPNQPYIAEASGVTRNLVRTGNSMRFDFRGDYKPFFRIAGGSQCRITVDGAAQSGLRVEVAASEQTSQTFRRVHVDCAD
jgi:peptidoglycan/xylan/chitin deacetylase (PgdA/CDA1 family)